jgi:hypothetical protein
MWRRAATTSMVPPFNVALPLTLTRSLAPLLLISISQTPRLTVKLPLIVKMPIEFPGAIAPPLTTTLPMMLPTPLRMPPFTTTLLFRLPFTVRSPALSVVPPPTLLVPVRLSLPGPFLVSVPVPFMSPA